MNSNNPTESNNLIAHLSELADETSTLFRKEIELARSEMKENVAEMKRGLALVGASGAVAYAGALFVLGGITLFLAKFIPLWAAALLIGLAAAGAGSAMFARGKKDIQPDHLVPRRTLRSVKETKHLVETPA